MLLRKEVCYQALLLSILKGYTPEQAFDRLDPTFKTKEKNREQDTEDMCNMRDKLHMSYSEIAYAYNLCPTAVFRRIKNYKQKKGVS